MTINLNKSLCRINSYNYNNIILEKYTSFLIKTVLLIL